MRKKNVVWVVSDVIHLIRQTFWDTPGQCRVYCSCTVLVNGMEGSVTKWSDCCPPREITNRICSILCWCTLQTKRQFCCTLHKEHVCDFNNTVLINLSCYYVKQATSWRFSDLCSSMIKFISIPLALIVSLFIFYQVDRSFGNSIRVGTKLMCVQTVQPYLHQAEKCALTPDGAWLVQLTEIKGKWGAHWNSFTQNLDFIEERWWTWISDSKMVLWIKTTLR